MPLSALAFSMFSDSHSKSSSSLYKQRIETLLDHHQETVSYIKQQLAIHQLPKQLYLLPLIESSYRISAVSHKQAAGIWQFMPATARQYGLTVNAHHDERFDIKRSTHAAMRHIRYLYNLYDKDLDLTLAAYNAGEGRVNNALRKHPLGNKAPVEQLSLPLETRNYVKKYHDLSQLFKRRFFAVSFNSSKPIINMNKISSLVAK